MSKTTRQLFSSVQAALAGGGLFLLLGAMSCQSGGAAAGVDGPPPPGVTPPPAATPPVFNATRAFADLEAQVAFGPRVPNTEGHVKTRDWLLAELKKTTDRALLQNFTRTFSGKKLAMSNIVGVINPEAKRQILLCAHWDTRPTADQEIEPARRARPIAGANDGASGVAVLLELARMFQAKRPPGVGVQFVLFDGEDYGPGLERMFLGARYYASKPALPKPDYAVLLDMVGDKDLQIYREQNSESFAPEINDKIWKAAEELKITAFQYGVRHTISDDHIPLQEVGWKAIDLIDFDYAPWHTLDDTPDKCSPASLKAVGDVVARVVYSEK